MAQPLMPVATAVWLIDNTTLTFKQIADFCGLHELEVQGIADGTVGAHIVGVDPVASGELTWEEIRRCEADPEARLQLSADAIIPPARTKGARYTPVSKRQDKPDAIAWLIKHHPELSDAQICRLVGTTRPTIQAIRNKTHRQMSQIQPRDPVQLGLCRQDELDQAVAEARAREERRKAREAKEAGGDMVSEGAPADAAGAGEPVAAESAAEAAGTEEASTPSASAGEPA
ncbi:MAG: DUF1013 domain-containing protein [Alphaproteobacteria bacterium]|nr:MAG: DUF1013 domain-containing protein [Alphaproteobacteria bacterium]